MKTKYLLATAVIAVVALALAVPAVSAHGSDAGTAVQTNESTDATEAWAEHIAENMDPEQITWMEENGVTVDEMAEHMTERYGGASPAEVQPRDGNWDRAGPNERAPGWTYGPQDGFGPMMGPGYHMGPGAGYHMGPDAGYHTGPSAGYHMGPGANSDVGPRGGMSGMGQWGGNGADSPRSGYGAGSGFGHGMGPGC